MKKQFDFGHNKTLKAIGIWYGISILFTVFLGLLNLVVDLFDNYNPETIYFQKLGEWGLFSAGAAISCFFLFLIFVSIKESTWKETRSHLLLYSFIGITIIWLMDSAFELISENKTRIGIFFDYAFEYIGYLIIGFFIILFTPVLFIEIKEAMKKKKT